MFTGDRQLLIGMVHAGALPGTPFASRTITEIARHAADEARALVAAGFDSIIIENMHDRPYLLGDVGPEIVAGMTRIGVAVRDAIGESVPIGVQILAGANKAALAVAQAIGAAFIRAEGFVFASVADEGLLAEAAAGSLLRFRKQIGAESIQICADVKKKHSSHAITSDVTLAEMARAAQFFGAGAVVVTGRSTGEPTAPADLAAVRSAVSIPLLAGSGATPESLPSLFRVANAVIVGSWYKRDGLWSNEIDPERLAILSQAAVEARATRGRQSAT